MVRGGERIYPGRLCYVMGERFTCLENQYTKFCCLPWFEPPSPPKKNSILNAKANTSDVYFMLWVIQNNIYVKRQEMGTGGFYCARLPNGRSTYLENQYSWIMFEHERRHQVEIRK